MLIGIDKSLGVSDKLNRHGFLSVTMGDTEEEWLKKGDAETLIAHLQKLWGLPVALEYKQLLSRAEKDAIDGQHADAGK